MNIPKYIWVSGKRYYRYKCYDTYKKAEEAGKRKTMENKRNQNWIMNVEVAGLLSEPRIVHVLYCTKFMRFCL